jgi:hypothetical protein
MENLLLPYLLLAAVQSPGKGGGEARGDCIGGGPRGCSTGELPYSDSLFLVATFCFLLQAHCFPRSSLRSDFNKPVPAKKENLKVVTFLNCNCISPESPGRRLIEETEFSFLLERAYPNSPRSEAVAQAETSQKEISMPLSYESVHQRTQQQPQFLIPSPASSHVFPPTGPNQSTPGSCCIPTARRATA